LAEEPLNSTEDRTDPFLKSPAPPESEELLTETDGAKLVRIRRDDHTQLRWTHENPSAFLDDLMPGLPDFLPGCEDLLLQEFGYTACDFDFTVGDAASQLTATEMLPLLAQAYELCRQFRARGLGASVFEPERLYLRNQDRSWLSGLNDFRLHFYHLEDLSPDAEQLALVSGLAELFRSIRSEHTPATGVLADNLEVVTAFAEAVVSNPYQFESTVPRLRIALEATARTDVGLKRDNNEDAYLLLNSKLEGAGESSSLFAVADGMGGHNAGEVASSLCMELLRFYSGLWPLARSSRRQSVLPYIVRHLKAISEEIYESAAASAEQAGMGTTLTGVFATCHGALESGVPLVSLNNYIFHVGDSRAFALNGVELRPLTRDHSYVQQLIDSGSLSEEEAYVHPRRNVISQGMGIAPEVKPDVASFEMPLDAYTVICSDGLTDLVREPRLIELAGEAESADALADALVREALSEGGKDNVTVIILTPRVTFEK
jgi:protein phosphatase